MRNQQRSRRRQQAMPRSGDNIQLKQSPELQLPLPLIPKSEYKPDEIWNGRRGSFVSQPLGADVLNKDH